MAESLDAEGDALGRKGMEHAKQDAHEVPIRTDAQPKHIEEEGRRRQLSEPANRSVWITKVSHAAEVSSDRTK